MTKNCRFSQNLVINSARVLQIQNMIHPSRLVEGARPTNQAGEMYV